MAMRRRRGIGRWLRPMLVWVVVIAVFWFGGLFVFANGIPDRAANTDTRTEAVVVLTGGSGRLRSGLDLLIADQADQLFVSGVYRGVDVDALLAVAKQNPIDVENRISLGNAVDTIENAQETATWMRRQGYSSLRLVTAAYHMPRSLLEFRAAMPEVTIMPYPVFPEHVKQDQWWAWPGTSALTITEYNKYLLAWSRQQIRRLLSALLSAWS